MGRLPATWAGIPIKDRFPYEMPGELVMTTATSGVQFPDALFNNGTDKPFECHRMIPRVYAQDSQGLLLTTQPDQELLQGLVRVEIVITNLEQKLTKAPTLLGALTKGSSERTWEFADPFYLIKSNNVTFTASTLAFPSIQNLVSLRIAITLEGFFIIVAPPANNR